MSCVVSPGFSSTTSRWLDERDDAADVHRRHRVRVGIPLEVHFDLPPTPSHEGPTVTRRLRSHPRRRRPPRVAALALRPCSAGGSSGRGRHRDRRQAHDRDRRARRTRRGSMTTSPSPARASSRPWRTPSRRSWATRSPTSCGSARTFDSAIAPGPKDWDLNIQQFSITRRAQEGRRLLVAVLHDDPGRRDDEGLEGRIGDTTIAGAEAGQDRRRHRHDEHTRSVKEDARRSHRRSSTPTTTPCSRSRPGRSTRSSPTCRPRSTSPARSSTTAPCRRSSPTDGKGDEFGFVLPKDSALTAKVTRPLSTRSTTTAARRTCTTKWLSSDDERPGPEVTA